MTCFHPPLLRNFTKATNVRLRFLHTNTLRGHLTGKALRDPTVTRRILAPKTLNSECNWFSGKARRAPWRRRPGPDEQRGLQCRREPPGGAAPFMSRSGCARGVRGRGAATLASSRGGRLHAACRPGLRPEATATSSSALRREAPRGTWRRRATSSVSRIQSLRRPCRVRSATSRDLGTSVEQNRQKSQLLPVKTRKTLKDKHIK
ncbi:uncharacterized protein [Eulemur rufifrons]|uniref:uncharacterized protein isoform X2 n=1 Tax=Eulemur rufifrons TaxID=859984 RepID=UPI003743B66F